MARKARKRPRTKAEAVQKSLSNAVQDPTTSPLEDAHTSHMTSDQATQPSDQAKQPSQASHPPQPIQPSSNEMGPNTSTKKRGRGNAKGIKNWGTGSKLKVTFDAYFQPLGDEGTQLKGQLGTILRNPHRVPLTYLDWDSVPEDIKTTIWNEIEDNIEDCPKDFQPAAMRACNKIWKDYKGKTKEKYYTKCAKDPDILLKVPKTVLPDQWEELVTYWRTQDAEKIANRNSINREKRGPHPRTGRKHFSQVRREMSINEEKIDKMSVFIKTRDMNDPDVKKLLEEFNEKLAKIPEPLQTTEARDEIFHDVFGADGHGYCKTYGSGVPRRAVYGESSCPSHASSSSTANEINRQVREATQEIEQRLSFEIEQRLTKEIEQRLTGEIEQRLAGKMERMLNEKLTAHLERMGAQMALFESYRGINRTEQVLNITSEQPMMRQSKGDDIQDYDKQNGQEACLMSYTFPKHDVAEGIVVSKDPSLKVGGKPLGSEFWKILVKKAKKPNASLERPTKRIRTIGQAVGHFVAWRSTDVFIEEESL